MAESRIFNDLSLEEIIPHFSLDRFFRFLLQAFPVVLIGVVLFYIGPSILSLQVGEISLRKFFFLIGLSIPWMSHLACMPIYIKLGNILYENKDLSIAYLILETVPVVWALSTLVILFFGVGLGQIFSWETSLVWIYILTCSLHILFSQLMIYGQLSRKWTSWFFSWIIYGASLFFFPHLWFLPPLLGSLFLSIYLFFISKEIPFPSWDWKYFSWMKAGLFLGIVLWADKFFIFLFFKNYYNFNLIFFSLIPSVILLNYFFIFKSPEIEKKLNETINSICSESIQNYVSRMSDLYHVVKISLLKIFIFGLFVNIIAVFVYYNFFEASYENNYIFVVSFLLTFQTIVLNLLVTLRKLSVLSLFSFLYMISLGLLLFFNKNIYDFPMILIIGFLNVLLLKRSLPFWKYPHYLVFG